MDITCYSKPILAIYDIDESKSDVMTISIISPKYVLLKVLTSSVFIKRKFSTRDQKFISTFNLPNCVKNYVFYLK